MNKEIETLINNLEGCVGMFDYMLTPIENDLLLSYINELQQENKELHNKIDKLEDKIKQMDNRFRNGLCVDNYLGGKITRKLFKEMYEILKDSDVDE